MVESLQDLVGTQKLREAWPKIESNELALKAAIETEEAARIANDNAHLTSMTAHNATAIVFTPGETSIIATSVDGAIKEQDMRIDNLIINGDSGPEAADARVSAAKSKTFTVLKDRLEESEEDFIVLQAETATGWYNAVTAFGAKPDGVTDNADAFARMSAMANASEIPVTIFLQPGVYKYSDGLVLTKEPYVLGYGAKLEYTGTGKAIAMGADGLTNVTYERVPFIIEGVTFTGGDNMTHGIYFNKYNTMPRLHNVHFNNFGNANSFGICFAGNNWDSFIQGGGWYANGSTARNICRVYPDGINATRLRVLGFLATNQSSVRGMGFWLDGANNEIAHCKIEAFTPNIRVGVYATQSRIVDTYFETVDNGGCIQYGGVTGESFSTSFTTGLVVQNCYANMHNTDYSTTSNFLEPTSANGGLQGAIIENNDILNSNREIVRQNNKASQTSNAAYDNKGTFTSVHNTDTLITKWNGTQGALYVNNAVDEATYHDWQAGKTAKQNHGHRLLSYNGTVLASWEVDAFNQVIFKNGTNNSLIFDGSNDANFTNRVKAKNYFLTTAITSASAGVGQLFEDSSNGHLSYKNLAGTVFDLTT